MLTGKAMVVEASQLQGEKGHVCAELIADYGRIAGYSTAARALLVQGFPPCIPNRVCHSMGARLADSCLHSLMVAFVHAAVTYACDTSKSTYSTGQQ